MKAFITFEGIEGCGKTTQIQMAGDYLRAKKIPVLMTEEPGGAPLGKQIRKMLLNLGECRIDAEAELLLFAAARAQHVREVILPALAEGRVVLCDRFCDATLAYQGYGRGLSLEFIRKLHSFSAAGLMPDRTFLFDLPVETGLGRAIDRIARVRGAPREDRFEQEGPAFHRQIRDGYLMLAAEEPERFCVIDAARDVQTVFQDVCSILTAFISSKGFEADDVP
jgi:dTMP kinase